jgi:hypothetical protein
MTNRPNLVNPISSLPSLNADGSTPTAAQIATLLIPAFGGDANGDMKFTPGQLIPNTDASIVPIITDKNLVANVLVLKSDGTPVQISYTNFVAGLSGGSTAAPVNTALPIISGTAQVGQTLTCTQGTWSNSPTSYTYQWNRAGTAISGATSTTYIPVTADIGSTLTYTVTATNAGGSTSATSAATAAVIAAASGVPVNSAVPVITGTAQVGQTLTASQGTWSNSPTGYAYQWYRAGTAISGATASTYVPVTAGIGSTLTVTVTATNASGSASATSAPTSAVIAAASGGGISPLTFTGVTPAFETTSPIEGVASLKIASAAGSATSSITLPVNSNGSNQASTAISFRFKGGGTVPDPFVPNDFMRLTDSSGAAFGAQFVDNTIRFHATGALNTATVNIRDGASHFIKIIYFGNYGGCYFALEVDGIQVIKNNGGASMAAGVASFKIDQSFMRVGDLLDSILIEANVPEPQTTNVAPVPTGAPVRDGNTVVIYTFDGQDGVGS